VPARGPGCATDSDSDLKPLKIISAVIQVSRGAKLEKQNVARPADDYLVSVLVLRLIPSRSW
jgi:hypothetical protein